MDLHEIEFRGLKTVAELPALGAAPPTHVYMCSSARPQSGWEGNNTERKTGSGPCFPSFGPPPPPRPPCPFLTVIALCAFSSLTLIVLSVEVKVVLTYLSCISNKPQRSPESIIETQSNLSFFLFFFVRFWGVFCDWSWTVSGSCAQPLTGNPACFFPFFPPDVTLALMLKPTLI